jgi:hypothetical protein
MHAGPVADGYATRDDAGQRLADQGVERVLIDPEAAAVLPPPRHLQE